VEGHRYADDAEPSWYSGRSQYDPSAAGSHALGNSYDSGIHERPSGAFRLPDPLLAGGPVSDGPTHSVRGPEYPTIKPGGEPAPAPELPASVAEPTSLVAPVGERRPADTVYQSRRPVSSIIVAVVMVVLMLPVLRLLADSTFTGDPTARGIVPAVLLTLGLALTGIGLFAIARGGPISRESWLRPPVAYLPAGLILMVAAGLAVA
jgi:hypothetical protein